jgi:hypothetical protein
VASFRKLFKGLHIEPFVSLTFLAQIATKFTKRALLKEKHEWRNIEVEELDRTRPNKEEEAQIREDVYFCKAG